MDFENYGIYLYKFHELRSDKTKPFYCTLWQKCEKNSRLNGQLFKGKSKNEKMRENTECGLYSM